MGSLLRTARDWGTKRTKELGANLGGSWNNQLRNAKDKYSSIRDNVGSLLRTARDWGTKRTQELGANLGTSWKNQSRNASDKYSTIRNTIGTNLRQAKEWGLNRIHEFSTSAVSSWNKLKDSAWGIFKKIGKAVYEPIQWAKTKLQDAWNSILDGIAKVLDALKLKDLAGQVRGGKWQDTGTKPQANGTPTQGSTPTSHKAFAVGGVVDKKAGGLANPRERRIHEWGEGDYHEAYLTTDPKFRRDNDRYAAWYASKVGGLYWPAPTAKIAQRHLYMAKMGERRAASRAATYR